MLRLLQVCGELKIFFSMRINPFNPQADAVVKQ
jgi:hypothetical protein